MGQKQQIKNKIPAAAMYIFHKIASQESIGFDRKSLPIQQSIAEGPHTEELL